MFDLKREQSHFENLSSVAQETYFNDAHRRLNGTVTDGHPNDLYERQFQVWEDQFLDVRRAVLEMAEGKRVGTWDERRVMSTYAALQLLRTRQARDALIAECTAREIVDPVLTPFLPEHVRTRTVGDPSFVREHISLLHSLLLWGHSSAVPAFAGDLFNYIWVIARNLTPYPFYTSDAPIATVSHPLGTGPYYPDARAKKDYYGEISLAKRLFGYQSGTAGQELIFPLAPSCALLMFHPYDFENHLAKRQGSVLVLGWESVLQYNVAIAGSAMRQVFSLTPDFRCAEIACEYRTGEE